MAIEVDLSVVLDLTVGSVPVSLRAHADKSASTTDLIFEGSVADVSVSLSDYLTAITLEFGIQSALPAELGLAAVLDYVVAQIARRTSPTSGTATRVLVAGRFDVRDATGEIARLDFYACIGADGSQRSGTPFVVGAAFDTALDLANLPVVGSIPGLSDLSLRHIGFSYASGDPGAGGSNRQFVIPVVVKGGTTAAPSYTITDQGAAALAIDRAGFSLTAGLLNVLTGATQASFVLPITPQAAPSGPAGGPAPGSGKPAVNSSTSSVPVRWVDVNKTFGPVTVQKIGINYAHGEASFGLSAGLALGSFALSLDGLAISFPLPLPGQPAGNTVAFDLAGLSMDFSRGGLELGAAFLRVDEGGHPAFYGEVIVRIASFGLKALGGYTPASDAGPASFFIYASLTVPLGGPPFLFITGFAGGFGINRALVLPTLENLGTFILLPDNAPAEGQSASDTIKAVIPQLQSVFRDEPGEYWVAAGISFTSFEMIDAFALVTVAFGVDLQIAVLGSCAMTFPKGSPYPVAYVQVNLLASFTPSSGLLAVIGELTPSSFVFGGLVHISGGFAFYIWFSGPNAGEFVVSIGGYHPAFVRPAHYPAVPRLQMQFALGPLSVVGQAYFALTPAMMMAGLRLEAVWHSGGIRAWLDAGVDFLIGWAPFHYEATVYISVGCSVDLGLFTLDVHVGTNLTIWGPPFGGRADVDLDVTSFTIAFGAPQIPPDPVGWTEFRSALLPRDTAPKTSAAAGPPAAATRPADTPAQAATQNIVKAGVETGLIHTDVAGLDWIVDPDRFAIVINSTVPANVLQWTGPQGPTAIPNSVTAFASGSADVSTHPMLAMPDRAPATASSVWQPVLGVRPMNRQDVRSTQTVTLTKKESGRSTPVTGVTVQPVLLDVSAALWGNTSAVAGVNDTRLVAAALVGLRITAMKRHPASIDNVPLDLLLYQRGYGSDFAFAPPPPDTGFQISIGATAPTTLDVIVTGAAEAQLHNADFVLAAFADPWVESRRAALVSELATIFSTRAPEEIDVRTTAAATRLTDWPAVAVLTGEPVARPVAA